jgi:hypothetical protein
MNECNAVTNLLTQQSLGKLAVLAPFSTGTVRVRVRVRISRMAKGFQ